MSQTYKTATVEELRAEMEIERQVTDDEDGSGEWTPDDGQLRHHFLQQLRDLIGDTTGRLKTLHYWVYLGQQHSDCTIIYRARIRH